jgi:hypothetical protein
MKTEAVRGGAKRFAAALVGPFGRRSLHRATALHLDYFVAARDAGATWSQIAQALAVAGAVGEDGKAIKGSVLSATVSRILRSRQSKADAPEVTAGYPTMEVKSERFEPVRLGNSTPQSVPSRSPETKDGLATVRERMERAAKLRGGKT